MATQEDKTNTGALLTLLVVSAFAMVGVALAVTAIARDEMDQDAAEKAGSGANAYHQLRQAQLAKLETGTPIEQVMQNVVHEFAADPSKASPPAPASAQAAIPAPSGSGAPAPTPAAATPTGGSGAAAPAPTPDSSAAAKTPAHG
jgi:hypothetical protein